ncbi:tuberoinfundibular peptide of 39 residues [Pelobates fuscus]|uniref:tuberoinfundibular peptide of 39 residues n=1 Tax=Pelobates fuscus TaxID=191477 RepID=UPI002FE475ED
MEKRTTGRYVLPITALLGYCIVLSSAAIIPSIRNQNRFWRRDLSDESLNDKQLDPFLPRSNSWSQQLPSITLHDWSLKMLSSDFLPNEPAEERGRKLILPSASRQLLFGSNDVTRKVLADSQGIPDQRWLPSWPTNEGLEKRNIVVADDAAFREKSKMLTAMERQKWLNSYMQKLLVVNST